MTIPNILGREGITATNANFLANVAKEMYEAIESRLEGLKLYNRDYTLAVNGNSYRVENESEKAELENLADDLREVSELKSLIAFLREAIKAKEALSKGFEAHLSDLVKNGRDDLKVPSKGESLTFEEEFGKLTTEQKSKYYALEAKCSTIGKYIHPDGDFAKARKDFFNHKKNPTKIMGSGQEAEIYTYSSGFTAEEVDEKFFELQKEHRSLQAEFNKMKAEIDERVAKANKEAASRYADAMKLVVSATAVEEMKFNEEVKALKIVVPQNLKGIYEKVNKVASRK